MPESLFICYPEPELNLAEKLYEELCEVGVPAWIYSIDRTAGRRNWDEIEERIQNSRAVVVIVSAGSTASAGQQRELNLARDAIRTTRSDLQIIPLALDVDFQRLPSWLGSINGFVVDRTHVPALACTLAEQMFPEALKLRDAEPWRFPRPGEWLKVIAIDDYIDHHFRVGDEVYFRRISPMGFFECFCPQIDGLFWFYPPNLGRGPGIDRERDRRIPLEYSAVLQFDA